MSKFLTSMTLSVVVAALFVVAGVLQLSDGKTLAGILLLAAAALWVVTGFLRLAERKKQGVKGSDAQH